MSTTKTKAINIPHEEGSGDEFGSSPFFIGEAVIEQKQQKSFVKPKQYIHSSPSRQMGFRPSLLDWHPNVNNNYGDYNENGPFFSNFYHHHQQQQQYSPNVDHHLFNYNNVLQQHGSNIMAAQQNFNPTRYSLPKLTSVPNLDSACRLRQWVSPSSSINQNNSTPHLPSFVEREKRDRTISMSSSTTSGREQKISLKKTKICEHWRRSGQCSYGELCWYAHGEFDLRKSTFAASKTDVRKKEEEKKSENGKTTKRASTNVKGLTVNIPMSITTMDSSSNSASMPLSPAQERWISMSLGSNSEKTSTSSAFSPSNHQDTSTSTSTVILENLEDLEKPEESPRIDLAKQQHQHQKQNLYHEYPNYQHNSSYNHSVFTNRSYGRGPNHRQSVINHFNGIPQPPKMTRSNTCFSHMDNGGGGGGYAMRNGPSSAGNLRFPPPPIPPHPTAATTTTTTTSPSSSAPPQPHIQNPMYSHLVDEIYRRQKHIESGGKLETIGAPSLGPMSVPPPSGYFSNSGYDQHVRKNEALFRQMYSNMLCQQQQQQQQHHHQQQRHDEIGASGFQQQHSRRDFQAQHSERILNRTYPYQQQAHLQQAYQHQQRVSHPDCPCSRQKSPYLQPPPQSFPSFSNLFPSVQSRPETPLQSPPKINESLLPNDDTFSIWFDSSKPKISGGGASTAIESDSNSSLLSKMEMLRAESVPIGEAEIVAASSMEEKCQYEEDVSPGGVLSLYDLLSNENLLNDDKEVDDPKKQMSGDNPSSPFFTNIFDFDLLNITVNSETTPTQSLYVVSDDRTPTTDTPEELMTPNPIINNNNNDCIEENVERCYFYSSAGNCPFGDACALAHSIDTD